MSVFEKAKWIWIDKEGGVDEYGDLVDEIRRDYKKMLDAGATSVWETIDGSEVFGGRGSLCHGWSAVPILYL